MPDLWSTVIGLIERYWKDKPRKDVIASLVELRENMMVCQRSYEECKAMRKQGDIDQVWLTEISRS